jgi:hypothetical protein
MPRPLEELKDEDAHAVADGAQSGAESGGCLAFARSGVDKEKTFARVSHSSEK